MNRSDFGAFRRAMSIILPLSILSLFLAGYICYVTNDIYAFVKETDEIVLKIEEPQSLNSFSRMLKKKKIVNNPNIFNIYVISKEKSEVVEGFSGELVLNSSMSYREILSSLS